MINAEIAFSWCFVFALGKYEGVKFTKINSCVKDPIIFLFVLVGEFAFSVFIKSMRLEGDIPLPFVRGSLCDLLP